MYKITISNDTKITSQDFHSYDFAIETICTFIGAAILDKEQYLEITLSFRETILKHVVILNGEIVVFE